MLIPAREGSCPVEFQEADAPSLAEPTPIATAPVSGITKMESAGGACHVIFHFDQPGLDPGTHERIVVARFIACRECWRAIAQAMLDHLGADARH